MRRGPLALFMLGSLAALAASMTVLAQVERGDLRGPTATVTAPERQAEDEEPTRRLLPRATLGGAPTAAPATGRCGVELWDVKTMTDGASGAVSLAPVPATVAYLAAQPAPRGEPPGRTYGVEEHVYRVRATLTGYKLERDSDLHLVLEQNGRTMIAEVPDPACARGSRVLSSIVRARARFLSRHDAASGCFRCLADRVTVDGVGFFDRLHGQAGVAPNGVELHPVVAISFR